MYSTKRQERLALEKIREIIKTLGENSYVGAAFDGCLAVAEENIKNDSLCRMKQKWETAEENAVHFRHIAESRSEDLEKAGRENTRLKAQLDQELEWRDYELKENVSQSVYDRLLNDPDSHVLTDEAAKKLLYDWFGFAKEKVKIIRKVPRYQVNRHRVLREIGTEYRCPLYSATDWNYIRFDCSDMSYELCGGELRFFM